MPRTNLSAGMLTELARLSGTEPVLSPVEIWVPLYPNTNRVRLVDDTDDLTLATGEHFTASSYELLRPNDVDRQLPRATMRFHSPGGELVRLIENTNGAQGAFVRIVTTRRSNPVAEFDLTIEVQQIRINSLGVDASLSFPSLKQRAALNQRYEARTARGFW